MGVKTIRVTKNPLPQPMLRLVQGDANTQIIRFLVKKEFGGNDLYGLDWSVWVHGFRGEAEVSYIGHGTVSGDDIVLDWEVIPAAAKDAGITVLKLYGSNGGEGAEEYAWVSGNMQIAVTPTQLIDPGYDEDEVNAVRQLISDFSEHVDASKDYVNGKIKAEKDYVDGEIADVYEEIEADRSERAALNTEIKNDQKVLGERLSLLEAGTTPEGSEVIGIRTGADGVVYTTAGDAVRGQIGTALGFVSTYAYQYSKNAYYDLNSNITIGSPTATGNDIRYAVIECAQYDTFVVTATGMSGLRCYAFVDAATGTARTIQKSDLNTSLTGLKITAPALTKALIVHSKGVDPVVYKLDGAAVKVAQDYTDRKIADVSAEVVGTTHVQSVNLYDVQNVGYVSDAWRPTTSGNISSNAGYAYTNPIPLKAGTYVTRCYSTSYVGNAPYVGICDANGTRTGRATGTILVSNGDKSIMSFTMLSDGYIWINTRVSDVSKLMLCAGDSAEDYPSEYVQYKNYYEIGTGIHMNSAMKEDISKFAFENRLVGKRLTVNGDSICAGAGYSGGYAKIIAEKYEMTLTNKAVGGGTFIAASGRHCIASTIASMDSSADYAILEGGVNDAMLGNTIGSLGSITAGFNDTLDTTTFYGSVESAFKQLVKKYAGKKYGFIIVHQATSDASKLYPGGTYYNALVECAAKWGVPVLDLAKEVPPFGRFALDGDAELLAIRDAYTKIDENTSHAGYGHGDGLHPNQAGYEKYYVPKIEAWMNGL